MSQNEPKINPATGYVHYEEPEAGTPVVETSRERAFTISFTDPTEEPEAQEATE